MNIATDTHNFRIYDTKEYNWDTINSVLNTYFPTHWIELNWLEQYSEKYNTIFYEANKISVNMEDGNVVVVDLHANSRVEWRRVNHSARCYLDYLALYNHTIREAINEIRAEYESSLAWKLWNSIINLWKKIKLDKLYFFFKK